MDKKTTYIIVLITLIVVSAYAYFTYISPEADNKDRLSKSEIPGVEENINAYNIEDDYKLTRETQRKDRVLALSPEETEKLLENIGPKRKNTVLHQYNSYLPENINKTLQYLYYNISYDYFLLTAEEGANAKENPDPASPTVGRINNMDKVSLLQRVDGEYLVGSNIWYRVAVQEDGQLNEGYLHSNTGVPRRFRFEKMDEAVNKLTKQLATGPLHFISNYRNENGNPPRMGEIAADENGYRVYHSAPAYEKPGTDANYRYVPDGMLLRILKDEGDFYHVNIPSFNNNYYVPKQYIDPGLDRKSV